MYALPNRNANNVAEQIRSFFATYDCPFIFIFDNAPEFTSNDLNKLCEKHNIKKVVVVPYHPQSNGLCGEIDTKIPK